MRWFRRRSARPGTLRGADPDDLAHLEEFVRSRRGVEAYVEPRTAVTAMTVVLVAHDGEWTRRRVEGAEDVRRLGKKLALPVYDVGSVGYPPRMREWTRRKQAGEVD